MTEENKIGTYSFVAELSTLTSPEGSPWESWETIC